MKSTMNIINCLIVIDIRNSYICGVIEPISAENKALVLGRQIFKVTIDNTTR